MSYQQPPQKFPQQQPMYQQPPEPLKGTLTYEVPTSTKSFVLGFTATLTGQQVNWDIATK